ncbi:hypothetical protein ACFPYJ_26125 [Paenibacillus solisilvae]|uniref:Uncharacterized protein n=1 Tax=Paenibacillus solisilvae TaxID=2486751 RepID=A0ABW0W518_9BACL
MRRGSANELMFGCGSAATAGGNLGFLGMGQVLSMFRAVRINVGVGENSEGKIRLLRRNKRRSSGELG